MRRIQAYIITILTLGMVIMGCNKQDDFTSSSVDPQPTAKVEVSAVADSTLTLKITSSSAGYLGYILTDDTTLTVAAINILSGNMADDVNSTDVYKIPASGDTTLTISGLIQNNYYKLYVASSNNDGVESNVVTFVVKTNDGYAPNLVSASPSPSDDATVEVGASLSYEFDEPILVDSTKVFTLKYLLQDTTITVSNSNISVSGKVLTVEQAFKSHPGDYFTISWTDGAITDLSGNAMDAITSSYDLVKEEGDKLFYRTENSTFEVADGIVMPESDSILSRHDFFVDIKFPYAISLLKDDITSDMITFKYTDWQELSVITISGIKDVTVIGDSTLRIVQPYQAKEGDKIELAIAEGVVEDMYNNVNAASEYKLGWSLGDFHVYSASFFPSTDSILRVQDFIVKSKFDFPITLINDSTGSAIYFQIKDANGDIIGNMPIAASIDPTNDSTLLLPAASVPLFTNAILMVEENAIMDAKGNVNLELKKEISWSVEPELAYDINTIIGSYEVTGASAYGAAYDIIDTVTFAIKTGTTDSLVMTSGLFGFDATIYAAYNSKTSLLKFSEQVIFSGQNAAGSDRIYTVFGPNDDYSASGYLIKDGTLFVDGLALGVYDGTFAWLGYGNKIPNTKWTKLPASHKSSKISTKKKNLNVTTFKAKKGK